MKDDYILETANKKQFKKSTDAIKKKYWNNCKSNLPEWAQTEEKEKEFKKILETKSEGQIINFLCGGEL